MVGEDLVLRTTKAPVWRGQVSHGWIDHAILNVSLEQAREWAAHSNGSHLVSSFPDFEEKARWLGDHLTDFSPAVLLDELGPLKALDATGTAAMRACLDAEFTKMFDLHGVRERYFEALLPLLEKTATFRDDMSRNDGVCADGVARGWAGIQAAAVRFKAVLQEVPRGVLIP